MLRHIYIYLQDIEFFSEYKADVWPYSMVFTAYIFQMHEISIRYVKQMLFKYF
jgi:hypothetical protein